MGTLANDIQAILDISKERENGTPRAKTVGFLKVFGGDCIRIHDFCSAKDKAKLQAKIEKCFCTSDENSRIALAFTSRSEFADKIWDSVPNFCNDDIAGVFMFKGRGETKRWAKLFLEKVPCELWQAKLPILYDEYDVLSIFSPESRGVDRDKRLLFKKLENMLDDISDGGYAISDLGLTERPPLYEIIPMYDASGLEKDVSYARKAINRSGMWNLRSCWVRMAWEMEKCKKTCPDHFGSLKVILSYIDSVLPGSVDEYLFESLEYEEVEKLSCPIVMNKKTSPEFGKLCGLYENVENVFSIIIKGLQDHNSRKDTDPALVDLDLGEFLEAIGAPSQLEALKAGVPIEDILV